MAYDLGDLRFLDILCHASPQALHFTVALQQPPPGPDLPPALLLTRYVCMYILVAEVVEVAPIRLLGKVSLSDEIKMLDQLRSTLQSAREQARLIADSTGDEETKAKIGLIPGTLNFEVERSDFCYYKAVAQQGEASNEVGRAELRKELGRE